MALQNIIEYDEIKEQLRVIEQACEDTKSSLDAIDNQIKTSVGADGAAWTGASAEQFRNSWDDLAADLPTFISYVNMQAKNIDSMLVKTQATDENGAVQ